MGHTVTDVVMDMFDIDEGTILEAVLNNYRPEQIFPPEELEEWAKANGFYKITVSCTITKGANNEEIQ